MCYWLHESGLYSFVFGSQMPCARLIKRGVANDAIPQTRKIGVYVSDNYQYSRNEPEFVETDEERCDKVRRPAKGREDALHYKVVAFVRKPSQMQICALGVGSILKQHTREWMLI